LDGDKNTYLECDHVHEVIYVSEVNLVLPQAVVTDIYTVL